MPTRNAGEYWIGGYFGDEDQPTKTQVTGSTIMILDNFGDAGNTEMTNGIVMYSSPQISMDGGNQTIFAKGDANYSFSVSGGGTAKIGWWMSADETDASVLELANYLLVSEGESATESLNTALNRLKDSGYWNSYTSNISPFS